MKDTCLKAMPPTSNYQFVTKLPVNNKWEVSAESMRCRREYWHYKFADHPHSHYKIVWQKKSNSNPPTNATGTRDISQDHAWDQPPGV